MVVAPGNHFDGMVCHVVVLGAVVVEANCFIGVNAMIRDNITTARECVVGADALILKPTTGRQVLAAHDAKLHPKSSGQLSTI